jgi:exodeoxyribonuclease-1
MIYTGGFFAAADRHQMNQVLALPPRQLVDHPWNFKDARLPVMLFRYRARNYPDTLNPEEARHWDKDRRARLIDDADSGFFTLGDFRRVMRDARAEKTDDPKAQRILDQLDAWVQEIGLSEA